MSRPPTSPKSRSRQMIPGKVRRSSAQSSGNTGRVSHFAKPVLVPSRSRSLDGLLDGPSEETFSEKDNPKYLKDTAIGSEEPLNEGEKGDDGDKNKVVQISENCETNENTLEGVEQTVFAEMEEERDGLSKSRSYEDHLDSESSNDRNGSMLSLPNSGDGKRKRNFMDKCVSKVKNLIRK